ncbi:Endothelin-converting enzyme 2 [Umbelopsis sp. WA50703]
MQSDSTQRLPLLSQAEGEDMDFHSDSDEPLQFFDTEKFTVREKLLGFASIMLLTGLLVFAYLYQQVGGGHHHGGMNMAALDKPLCTSDTCILAAADMLQTMNTSANPCHEFHNYACGSVDSNRKDPTAQSVFKYLGQLLLTWNTTVFTDDADQESFEMLDKFYKSCIDRNPSNLSSLEAMITKLEAIMVTEDASDSVAFPTKTLGYLASNAIFPLFRLDVEQDIRNVTSYSLDISQSGLSLPSLLDYESNDAKTAFNSNIKRVLQIITKYGIQVLRNDSLEQFAEQVVATETALASISKSPDELYLESISKMQYHSSDLQSLVSAINWPEYFTTAIESKTIDLVYVRSADYLGNLQKLLSAGNLSNLKAYFTFQVLLAHANELPAEALHAMRSVNSNLVQDEADSCLIKTNDVFGNLIGHYFPEASQDQVVFIGQLYDDIRRALAKNIPKFGWMDRMAIGHALHKLDHMTLEISHPINHTAGSPVHYQTLPITNDYVQNTITARKWKLQSSFDLLDTNDAVINWPVLPQDIGMVYQPIGNKVLYS